MRIKRKFLLFLISLLFVLGVSSQNAIGQIIWTVDDDGPADFSIIQTAIDRASPGDTVSVAAGTYAPSTNGEVFPITMKNGVSLIGAGAEVCILDAEHKARVINCSRCDSTTKIDGFTISNGALGWPVHGAGINCESSSPIITNNIIRGNNGHEGGGIRCYFSSPYIANNLINDCIANRGGAIYCYWSSPTIANNIIIKNKAIWAGGINCETNSYPTITNNLIKDNNADSSGGGIKAYSRSSPKIINNTITENGAWYGGGIHVESPSSPLITNNIITNNNAQYGGGIYCRNSSPMINYNDVWNNSGLYGPNFYSCGSGSDGISFDPLFVDPDIDDYHLQEMSPCIDWGDNNAPGLPEFDFDGNPRIINGVVDMGAYEFGFLLNQPPIAVCKNIEIPADENCSATITAADVDGGSYDPDGPEDIAEITIDNSILCGHGDHSVSLTIRDLSGESDTCTATVTVVDNTPPVPDIPGILVIEDECSVEISTPPTAWDNCAGQIKGTTDSPLPITFTDQGTYHLTWTYDDGNGNTISQKQTIIIDDITPPVPDSGGSLPHITGQCSVTVEGAPSAMDNCAGHIIGLTEDPLTYTEQGTFHITWTFDDGNGNVTPLIQTVIIEDTEPPVPDIDPLPAVTGQCSATISTVPTATDNCAGSIPGITGDPLTYTEQGTHTVFWIFEDGRGNITTQTQTVIVADSSPPTINNISAGPNLLWPANHKMVPVTLSVTVTDNCDPQPSCQIIGVTSNEPENGLGDGDAAPDWEITGDLTLYLRAERSGNGSGRIYTILVRCMDKAGNIADGRINVIVPHDKREKK